MDISAVAGARMPIPDSPVDRRIRSFTPQLSIVSSVRQSSLGTTSNEIIQQLRDVNKDVDTSVQFIRGINDIVCATLPINFVLVCIILYNLVEIFTGIKHLEDCPLEPRISVFLLVGGCFGLLKGLHVLSDNLRLRKHSAFESDKTILDRDQRNSDIVDVALNIFLFAWQMAGCYWTYSIWYPNFKPPLHQPTDYCAQNLYLFAVVQIGLFAGLVCLVSIFYVFLIAYYRYTNEALANFP